MHYKELSQEHEISDPVGEYLRELETHLVADQALYDWGFIRNKSNTRVYVDLIIHNPKGGAIRHRHGITLYDSVIEDTQDPESQEDVEENYRSLSDGVWKVARMYHCKNGGMI